MMTNFINTSRICARHAWKTPRQHRL